jgi:hypothetical protein
MQVRAAMKPSMAAVGETSCFARRVPDLHDPNRLRQILITPTF